MTASEAPNALLRHTLAALAYRAAKTLRGTPEPFGDFRADRAGDTGSRSAGQILAHMGDVIEWAHSMAAGQTSYQRSEPLPWHEECDRFFATLARLDAFLGSGKALEAPAERLFQGPIADCLTHTGQIALLRRLSGSPVKGENYFKADVVCGRMGMQQTAPGREFD